MAGDGRTRTTASADGGLTTIGELARRTGPSIKAIRRSPTRSPAGLGPVSRWRIRAADHLPLDPALGEGPTVAGEARTNVGDEPSGGVRDGLSPLTGIARPAPAGRAHRGSEGR